MYILSVLHIAQYNMQSFWIFKWTVILLFRPMKCHNFPSQSWLRVENDFTAIALLKKTLNPLNIMELSIIR